MCRCSFGVSGCDCLNSNLIDRDCLAVELGNLAGSLEVRSQHFQAALQRVPPSLARGVQTLSETGMPLILCMRTRSASFNNPVHAHKICLVDLSLAGKVHGLPAIAVTHLPE